MKANEAYFIEFQNKQNTFFKIPVYQRDYEWTESQCGQLLKDIYEVGKDNNTSSHFIGSIVSILEERTATEPMTITIIDGQQRLTTITLLWIVLYLKAEEINDPNLKEEIYELYLVNKFIKNGNELKEKLILTDNNQY